jgi:multiple sugar transport system substrate-binding protein
MVYLVIVISALLLVGALAEAKTTLKFWYPWTGGTALEKFEELLKEYERLNPDIDIESLPVDYENGQHTKTLTAIAAGDPADAEAFERSAVLRWGVVLKALTPLTDLAKGAGVKAEDYFPFSWREVSYGGQVYALPLHTDIRGLYWNKRVFREAGLNPDRPPQSIAELDEFADKITKRDSSGKIDRMGFIPWFGNWFFFAWGWSFGGDFYDWNTGKATANHPSNIKALEWEASYAKKYGINQVAAFMQGFASGANDPFLSGRVAMIAQGDWLATTLIKRYAPDMEYGTARVPHAPGGVNGTWSGGFSLVIARGSKHPKEGWELIRWLGVGADQQTKWASSIGTLPTLAAAARRSEFAQDPFIEHLPESHGRTPLWVLYFNRMLAAVDNAIYSRKTPKEALDEVQEAMQKDLDKEFPIK